MKKMVCDLCGSGEFTKDDEGLFVCDYCRTKYTPQQAKKMMVEGVVRVDRTDEVEKLISLAKSSLEHQNPEEAYDYASRALEIDTENWEAWFCKGKAAGWRSTLADVRFTEMIGAFKNALGRVPEAEKDSFRKECSSVMNEVAVAVHTISWDHAVEFVQADSTWAEHIGRCQGILSTFSEAYEWGGDRQPLDNIVHVASQLITGIKFDQFDGTPSVRFLQPEYQEQIQALIDDAAEKLRTFDEDYAAPRPEPQKACFVVTATMGNENSFPVVTLRQFRDELMSETALGKRFILWYQEYGPRFASLIQDSWLLRAISMTFVVVPATFTAWILLAFWNRER